MPWISFEALTGSAGMIASVAATIAGAFRFRAWWKDRSRQARIESATYLKEKGTSEWERSLGEEELRRAHFFGVSRIDRNTGHEAIRKCHQRLGGTDLDWGRLRGVGRFLVATGVVARVRKPNRRDRVEAAWAFAIGVLFGLVGMGALIASAAAYAKTDWSKAGPSLYVMLTLAPLYASFFVLIAIGAFYHCTRFANAQQLYKKLVELGKQRRRQSRRSALTAPDLQLEELSPRPEPPVRPYLVVGEKQSDGPSDVA